MKKMTFTINSTEYLRRLLKAENKHLTDKDITELLNGLENFKAIYTLYGNAGGFPDRYELTDMNGVKIDTNTLSAIDDYTFGQCLNYFSGLRKEKPDYVIAIC